MKSSKLVIFCLLLPLYLVAIAIAFSGNMMGIAIGCLLAIVLRVFHVHLIFKSHRRSIIHLHNSVFDSDNLANGRLPAGAMSGFSSQKNSPSTAITPINQVNLVVPDWAFHQPAQVESKMRLDGVVTNEFLTEFLSPLFSYCICRTCDEDYRAVKARSSSGRDVLYIYTIKSFSDGTWFPSFIRCCPKVNENQITLVAEIAYLTGAEKFMPYYSDEYYRTKEQNLREEVDPSHSGIGLVYSLLSIDSDHYYQTESHNVRQALDDEVIKGIFAKTFQAYDAVKTEFHNRSIEEVLDLAKLFLDRPNDYYEQMGLSAQPSNSPSCGVNDEGNIFTTTQGKSTQASGRRIQSGINKV